MGIRARNLGVVVCHFGFEMKTSKLLRGRRVYYVVVVIKVNGAALGWRSGRPRVFLLAQAVMGIPMLEPVATLR